MEKNLKELIAEMDRIEALEPNEDNQMQEGFADALKGVMDKIANKLGYQPKDPELADLFKRYAELQQEIQSVMKQIDAHPELRGGDPETRPVPPGTGPGTGTGPSPDQPSPGIGAPDPGLEPMAPPRGDT